MHHLLAPILKRSRTVHGDLSAEALAKADAAKKKKD
jgi:hypothetical protein